MNFSAIIQGVPSWKFILSGDKTRTWRPEKPGDVTEPDDGWGFLRAVRRNGRLLWAVGRTYAVQPGRGKKAVARIKITSIHEEVCPGQIGWVGLYCEGFRGKNKERVSDFRAVLEKMYRVRGDVMEMPGYWIGFKLVEGPSGK